ncbi:MULTISPECIES: LacI family DNA-binding transcriptional regulator [unclassified Curtobacterium]|uniref:LacI family DNA-binding transcriptional regulator n=1 Tax=unclassified Curtobacterium TaxID=257496 RepID=UPI000DA96668|nr:MULTISPECIES: LacI family DNA-binding transcriptional regulator [unclassified Curtobacterium]PZE27359.1 LacI family transcriptional regulator [Curtobacterium sp. MCBD17_028]PZF60114.1 LacI family transcriptional regulator [Curtobacterium sp. MCBD17_034]PZM34799.1 LacI family transcriptional regulator [Curtobacterium sp. MCBD17_031]
MTGRRPSSRGPTRRDVAQLAGVSDAVVSYTLNGGSPVAPATAQRVLAAVEQLGYQPNQAARALRSGSARTLVFLVPSGPDPIFANPFFSEYASTLEAAARERGYALYTTATSFEPAEVLARFREFASRQFDGVLVLPGEPAVDRASVDRVGLPWVALNVATPERGVGSLGVDLRAGAMATTRHLLEHGYERVGYVGEANPHEPRYIGWLQACADAGVAAGPFVPADITRPGGRDAGRRIAGDAEVRGNARAFFVASDRTAVGLMRAFHERGVAVPADVAIASFDGSWEGEYAWPTLTSFRQPIEEMARSAVQRVLEGGEDPRHELFDGELVLRMSCGCDLPG